MSWWYKRVFVLMIFYHNRKPNKMGFLKVLKSVGTSHFMHAAILTDQTESIETTRTKKTLHRVRPLLTFETARETIHIASPGRSLVPTEINVQTSCTHRNIQGKKYTCLSMKYFTLTPQWNLIFLALIFQTPW